MAASRYASDHSLTVQPIHRASVVAEGLVDDRFMATPLAPRTALATPMCPQGSRVDPVGNESL